MTKMPQVKTAKSSLELGGLDGQTVGLFGPADAPPVQKTFNFPLQSFFDARFADVANYPDNAAAALLSQPSSNQIVPGGMRPLDEGGYGFALSPDSDTPLAIDCVVKGGGKSGALVLLPGQVMFPFGSKGKRHGFESLIVGLPQGWLGGGYAKLFVLKSPRSRIAFTASEKELLFHRLQVRVLESEAPVDGFPVPPSPVPCNWPTTFTWQRARRGRYEPGTTTISDRFEDQNGTTTMSIRRVTKTLMVLRSRDPQSGAPLPVDANNNFMRIVWWSSDHFDAGKDGLKLPSPLPHGPQFYYDTSWPIALAGMPVHDPILSVDPVISGQRASLYGISLEVPAGSALIGQLVDICRYGIL